MVGDRKGPQDPREFKRQTVNKEIGIHYKPRKVFGGVKVKSCVMEFFEVELMRSEKKAESRKAETKRSNRLNEQRLNSNS